MKDASTGGNQHERKIRRFKKKQKQKEMKEKKRRD